jgi:hypothetical protein
MVMRVKMKTLESFEPQRANYVEEGEDVAAAKVDVMGCCQVNALSAEKEVEGAKKVQVGVGCGKWVADFLAGA